MKTGYKAFDEDLKCRNYQFKVGNEYKIEGELEICKNGFHYCEQLKDVYEYYSKNYETRVCRVEILGEVQAEGNKSCTNHIKIISELTKDEIKNLTDDLKFNSGNRNSGHYNSGDYNSGDYNSGNCNSGNRNSGNCNSGNRNSGHGNSGDYNSGRYNSGNGNSGHYNSGHGNSGDYNSGRYNSGRYNSGAYNSGYFNTNAPKIRLFNMETNLEFSNPLIEKLKHLNIKPILRWIGESDMTEQEKLDFPSYKTTGGYLKNTGRTDWSKLTDEDKDLIKSLPNYNDKIFKSITGISLLEQTTLKITVEGKEFEIDIKKAKELGLIK